MQITRLPRFSSDKVLMECVQWLKLYFDSEFEAVKKSFPSICPTIFASKGKFTACVWKTLASKVPPGETVSYGALAALCGNEGAGRAVGTAMATNPIPLVVPCHRVIRSDGTLGQYSRGKKNDIKEWLLAHEGAIHS
ncbi:unnamed protein product [Larinioides sclopetarius]|uniref:Methylated-DNA--protein-cysteine methyltransferase n=1 Tax=Larinioides sclopetarius TaxID=280406 RepID=A0AAV2A2Y2_9ARAC